MSKTLTPEVTWAQRSNANDPEKNILYITINSPDVPKDTLKLDLQPNKLTYEGTNKTAHYHVELEFYEEIDVENSKTSHNPRGVEMILRKKSSSAQHWPRLLKDSKRAHFLKTDFDKWVDEDEQDEDDNDLYRGMGTDDPGFGGLDFSKLGDIPKGPANDSDDELDEDLPELEDYDAAKKDSEVEGEESKVAELAANEAPKDEGEGKKPLIEEVQ